MGLNQAAVAQMKAKYGDDYFARLGSRGADATRARHGEDYFERHGNSVLALCGVEYYQQMGRKSAEKRKAKGQK